MTSKWPLVSLGEILTERKEKTDLEAILTGEIPIVAKIGFDTGKIGLREESKTKTNMILIKPGDLVISGINAAKGAIAVYGEENKKPAAATIHYSSYKIKKEKVDSLYLWYFMRSDIFRRILVNNLSNGIKTEVKPKRLLPIKISLPSIEEQRRIVAKIRRLNARIDKIKELKVKLQKEQYQFFQRIIEQSISYDKLNKLSSVLLDKPRNGYSVRCDGLEGGYPVLTLTAITGFSYTSEYKLTSEPLDPNAHYWLNPNDLLISRSNTLELVGHAAIYSGKPYPCVYPDLMMRLPIDEKKATKKFILFLLQTPLVRKFITAKAKGTSPTMKKISQKVVMDIPFPASINITEQQRIVAYLDSLQAKVDELKGLQAETEKELEELVPSILDKAFKGEL